MRMATSRWEKIHFQSAMRLCFFFRSHPVSDVFRFMSVAVYQASATAKWKSCNLLHIKSILMRMRCIIACWRDIRWFTTGIIYNVYTHWRRFVSMEIQKMLVSMRWRNWNATNENCKSAQHRRQMGAGSWDTPTSCDVYFHYEIMNWKLEKRQKMLECLNGNSFHTSEHQSIWASKQRNLFNRYWIFAINSNQRDGLSRAGPFNCCSELNIPRPFSPILSTLRLPPTPFLPGLFRMLSMDSDSHFRLP